jgi:hypothetical protein
MKSQARIRSILLISLFILYLPEFYFFLIKLGGFILFILSAIGLAAFISLAITVVIMLKRMKDDLSWRNTRNYTILLLIPVFWILSNSGILMIDENMWQSKVKWKACYEGTMSTSRLFIRENGTFEDFNIGFFAYVHYGSGSWQAQNDTIYLRYDMPIRSRLLADTLYVKNNLLYKVHSDSLIYTNYYLGDCKGLN